MYSFAIRISSLLLFWHVCWRILFKGIIAQSGFASDSLNFFARGLLTDLAVTAVITGLLCLIRYFSASVARFGAHATFTSLSVGFIFVTGYFQIFEKPAEFATVGAGLGTIAAEFFHSAIKEISAEIAAFAIGMLLSLAFFIWREHGSNRLTRRLSVATFISPPAAVAVAFTLMVFPHAATRDAAQWRGHEHTNPFLYALLKSHERHAMHIAPQEATQTPGGQLWQSHSVLNQTRVPATQIKRKPYNVIFYIMESTSAQYTAMTVKGKPVMPVFQRLKQHAFVANQHYTQFPLSVNARYNALMSAYNPPNKNWIPLSEPNFPAPTVFETLRDAGYKTAILHTASLENWNYRDFLKNRRLDLVADMYTLAAPEYIKTSGFSIDDRAYIKPAMRFIAESNKSPWFITFLPVMPHHPYTIPFPEFELYTPAEVSAAPSRSERLLREYLNALHYADATLGELVASLEKAGVLDDTLLFVFADHGEAFYQHPGNYLHALQVYEENVAIPFIIHNRKMFPQPVVYRGISRNIDVAPTAVDMVGLAQPASYMGVSLVHSHRPRLAYFHTDWENDISGIRDSHWKFIYRAEEKRHELYDVLADPEEKRDVSTQHPEITGKLLPEVLKARETQRGWYMKYRGR